MCSVGRWDKWHMPVTLGLRRWKQKHQGYKASLGHIVSLDQPAIQKTKTKEEGRANFTSPPSPPPGGINNGPKEKSLKTDLLSQWVHWGHFKAASSPKSQPRLGDSSPKLHPSGPFLATACPSVCGINNFSNKPLPPKDNSPQGPVPPTKPQLWNFSGTIL